MPFLMLIPLQAESQTAMSENQSVILLSIYVLLLAVFLGFELIGRVPATLHTPLMSGTNAIHGIVVLGAVLIMGRLTGNSVAENVLKVLAFIAVVLGAANSIGGFVVTDRMLEMFKKKPTRAGAAGGKS
jgi:NAD(P) transhydrogenase subunit alpha